MSKTYREWDLRQSFLLPPSLLEWLPEDHLVHFILDIVATLNISEIDAYYQKKSSRGAPPHHPRMMVALLLYAYCVGVPSSRKIEQRTREDVAFRILAGNTHPDYSCISEFRRIHLKALEKLFLQVLALCQKAGLVKLGVVALDGTKMKANASKHKAMSYQRMQEEQERLVQQVQELLQAAEAADASEDAQYGKSRRGDELPQELQRAQSRLQRIRQLQADLEAEAKMQAQLRQAQAQEEAQLEAALREMHNIKEAQKSGQEAGMEHNSSETAELGQPGGSDQMEQPSAQKAHQEQAVSPASNQNHSDAGLPSPTPEPLPTHQIPTDSEGQIEDKAQRCFTDSESRIMKTGDGYIQGYNGHVAVDQEHQIIVAVGLSNQAPDAEYFIPMLDETIANCGQAPDKVLGDAGFFSESNVVRAQCRGVEPYIAPERVRRGRGGEAEVTAEPKDPSSAKERMKRKLQTPEGAELYSRRKTIVEPVFGQIKNRGFRQFLLRGIEKVSGEWTLIALTHNLLKLFGARMAAVAVAIG